LYLAPDNHVSTSPLSFLQARCPSCHPTNSVKALKAKARPVSKQIIEVTVECRMLQLRSCCKCQDDAAAASESTLVAVGAKHLQDSGDHIHAQHTAMPAILGRLTTACGT